MVNSSRRFGDRTLLRNVHNYLPVSTVLLIQKAWGLVSRYSTPYCTPGPTGYLLVVWCFRQSDLKIAAVCLIGHDHISAHGFISFAQFTENISDVTTVYPFTWHPVCDLSINPGMLRQLPFAVWINLLLFNKLKLLLDQPVFCSLVVTDKHSKAWSRLPVTQRRESVWSPFALCLTATLRLHKGVLG